MQTFAAILARTDLGHSRLNESDNLLHDAKSATVRFLPLEAGTPTKVNQWRGSHTAIWHHSNEPEKSIPNYANQNGAAMLRIGYTDRTTDSFFADSGIADMNAIADSAGCFGVVRVDDKSIQFITDMVGSHIAYYTATEDFFVLSNRMTVASAVAKAVQGLRWDRYPNYDLSAIRGFAAAGHFNFSSSAFRDVFATQNYSVLSANASSVREFHWHDSGNQVAANDSSSYKVQLDSLAQALVKACAPIAKQDTVTLTLTGGRDSRLVASALAQFDVEVSTRTSGAPDHPDVYLAAEVAELLGWKHQINAPKSKGTDEPSIVAERVSSRVSRALDVFALETSAWDDIEGYGDYSGQLHISGVGGELLRGGYLATKTALPDLSTVQNLLRQSLRGGTFLRGHTSGDDLNWAQFVEMNAARDPLRAMDDLYLLNRNRRWVTARRRGQRFRRNTFDPLFDNRLVALARSFDIGLRWSEKLVFDVIAALTPPLKDVPLEGSPWRFESDDFEGPKFAGESNAGSRRMNASKNQSVTPDFRRLQQPSFQKHFLEALDSYENPTSRQLIDFQLLREEITKEGGLRYPTVAWHAVSAAALLSGGWIAPKRERGIKHEIKVN